jgi:hypothetical protein
MLSKKTGKPMKMGKAVFCRFIRKINIKTDKNIT